MRQLPVVKKNSTGKTKLANSCQPIKLLKTQEGEELQEVTFRCPCYIKYNFYSFTWK